ncbi:hypothetical protein G9X48_09115 [Cronobacter sp. HA18006]|uniref:hypothetical protein n=1 Tax=Cronobacter TaxID=413496 RepID=UPI0013FE3F48|nr:MULTISPECIES: hypothetical protein [Cronobacter]MDT3573575.1 hypothetical protein [Cronobacter sakazakii]NHW95672.1 hypothetical protein [Cronobacter sp. HA18006]
MVASGYIHSGQMVLVSQLSKNSKYIERLAVLTHYRIYKMIRIEFNTYDDGTYYFLYITEEVRIETNGIDGLQIETRDSRVRDLDEPFQYLTIRDRERKDEYFNESLRNQYIDTVIEAVKILNNLI